MSTPARSKVSWTFLASFALLIAAPAPADDRMEAVLRAYVEVWNTGEVDRLDELVTEGFRRHGGFAPVDSREKLRSMIEGSRRFYRDLHVEVGDLVAGPEKGAMRWRFTGGWGETRFRLDSLNFGMYHFVDGKISEEWVQGNNMDLFRAFGYRLTPPQHEIVPPPVQVPPGPSLAERMADSARELAAYAAETHRDAPERAGEFEVRSDVACRLSLDGTPVGWLEAGKPASFLLERGEHRLEAASLGGSTFFEETVEVRRGDVAVVEVKAPAKAIVRPRHQTIEDLATGLMWQMKDNGENVTLAGAEAHCRELRQGEHDDWRLPTLYELESLYVPEAAEGKRYRSIDGVLLSDCCPWTSTPHEDFYWTFVFSMGIRYLQYEALGYHMRVICVRDAGGPSA